VAGLLIHRASGDPAVDDRETLAPSSRPSRQRSRPTGRSPAPAISALLSSARIRSDPADGFVFAELVVLAQRTGV